MSRPLTNREEALVELVHFLATRSGLSPRKIQRFLETKVTDSHLTVLEHLDKEGMAFVNRLKIFVNQSEN